MFEIGNSLCEARLRRSIEFPQAEQATKIRVKYLRALEEERFEQLPSQTYVKGFLRTYADYLGLDGQLYVDEFNSRFVAGQHAEERPRRSSVRPEQRNRKVERNIVLLALTIVSIVTVVVISAWQSSGSGPEPTTTTVDHTPKKKAPASTPKFGLEISALKGSSYVEVHRTGPTGHLLFQGTIAKGQTPQAFKGHSFWVDITSPENLLLKAAGKTIPLSGLAPITLTVTRHGVETG